MLTTPLVSVQEQATPGLAMPTGVQPIAVSEAGGQRHAQEVGVGQQTTGVT
jgi:hypothetical protein